MLNMFLGLGQTSLGWMPSVNFRFRVTNRSKIKYVHFLQNTYGKMAADLNFLETFSLNNCVHFDIRATVLL